MPSAGFAPIVTTFDMTPYPNLDLGELPQASLGDLGNPTDELLRFHSRGHGFGDAVLLLPVADCGANRILGQHRAVNLYRRKRKLLDDIGVLDLESFLNLAPLDPFGCQRRTRDRRSAAERLELRLFDHLGLRVHTNLQ